MSSQTEHPQSRFDAMYRRFAPQVLAYLLRRTSREAAIDVASETWLTTWRRIDEVDEEPLPWLLTTARLTLQNAQRGQRRHLRLIKRVEALPAPTNADASPESAVVERRAVTDALAMLSPDDRELLQLIGWDELTPQEAAAVFGCSAATLRVRLHRARTRLAQQLDEQHVGTPSRIAKEES
jgi:RNA polymerase sigma-70 factor, ECF subfamily